MRFVRSLKKFEERHLRWPTDDYKTSLGALSVWAYSRTRFAIQDAPLISVRGMIELLFHTVHIITGVVVSGQRKGEGTPRSAALPPSPQQECCQGLPCRPCPLPWQPIPYQFLWDTVPRQGAGKQQCCEKHRGELSEEVSPGPAESSLSWRELSGARSSHVGWSAASGQQHCRTWTVELSGCVPHCFLFCAQRQESWLWEQLPSLSWEPPGHNLWAASAIMSVPAATES